MLRTFFGLVEAYRFRMLLALLLGLLVVQALGRSVALVQLLVLVLSAMTFFGALVATRSTAHLGRVGGAVVALWLALALGRLAGLDGVVAAELLASLTVVGLVATATFAALFREARADADTLSGAIFGYFLLALVWATLYDAVELWQPGSFALTEVGDQSGQLVYFSLVTITTLGYGDILPLSHAARMLAGLEAAVGTLYLAVLIGRIVGALKPRPARKAGPSAGKGEPAD